jgi:hypothetical protein
MFGIATLSPPFHGAAVVGIVLAEALVLYVGYGGLTRIAGPELEDAIRDR